MPQVYNKRHCNPPDAVYVGRPTKWGNPFTVEQYGRGNALAKYRSWIRKREQYHLRAAMRKELRVRI